MPLQQQYDSITDRAIIGMFFMHLNGAMDQSWVSSLCNSFSSNQISETYAGLGNVPMLREWIGGKQPGKLGEKTLTITNKDWESTLLVSNKDRRRDKTGQLQVRIGQLAQRAAQHREKLVSDLIKNGSTSGYASVWTGASTFFANSHTMGNGNTIDNSIDVDVTTTTAPTASEAATAILTGIQQFYGFKDDQGEPINQNAAEFTVMCPTTLWTPLVTAITSNQLAQGQDNPLVKSGIKVSIIQNARLNSSWTDKFAIFRSDGILKPFIIQTEVEPIMKALSDGSDFEFDNGASKFSVEWSGNVGYGSPDQAVLVNLT